MRLQCASRREAARAARTGFNGIDGLTLSLVGGESVQQVEAGSLTWSRAINPESKRRLGGTCGNAPRFTDGDAAGLCVAVPPVRQGGPAIAVRGRYPCTNERRWAWKAASALAVTGPPSLRRRWRRTAMRRHCPPAAYRLLARKSILRPPGRSGLTARCAKMLTYGTRNTAPAALGDELSALRGQGSDAAKSLGDPVVRRGSPRAAADALRHTVRDLHRACPQRQVPAR